MASAKVASPLFAPVPFETPRDQRVHFRVKTQSAGGRFAQIPVVRKPVPCRRAYGVLSSVPAAVRLIWLICLLPVPGESTAEIYCLEIAVPRPRSKYFCILPVAVFGRSFTNETQLGALKWARL